VPPACAWELINHRGIAAHTLEVARAHTRGLGVGQVGSAPPPPPPPHTHPPRTATTPRTSLHTEVRSRKRQAQSTQTASTRLGLPAGPSFGRSATSRVACEECSPELSPDNTPGAAHRPSSMHMRTRAARGQHASPNRRTPNNSRTNTRNMQAHSDARTQARTQARKHASTQARKHASTQARKHASTQARKHASTQARKHASTQARKHASTHAQTTKRQVTLECSRTPHPTAHAPEGCLDGVDPTSTHT
jgi:hypothetical protein